MAQKQSHKGGKKNRKHNRNREKCKRYALRRKAQGVEGHKERKRNRGSEHTT